MKIVQNIILFLSIIVFIGLVYISFFNVYQTDDYIFSYTTHQLGLFNNIFDFYSRWGGRYFGYSLSMLNPVACDQWGILPKVYPIFLLCSFIAVLILNINYYFKFSVLESVKKGFLFFFFYTVLLVSISEHYFWITGSNIYFLPFILSGLLLYSIGQFHLSHRRSYFYLSCLLIVLLMGSNEILALLLWGSLMMFYSQNKNKQNLALILLGTSFLLISFLAPGNFNRLVTSDESFATKWFKRIAIMGANSTYIFIKIILVIPLFVKIFEEELSTVSKKVNLKTAGKMWLISFLPLIFVAFIFNTIGRQFESIMIFYLGTGAVVWMFLYEQIKKYWWISLIVIFLPSIDLFPPKYSNFNLNYNLNTIIEEVFQTNLHAYHTEIRERIETIENSKQDSLILPKIHHLPKVLYFEELPTIKEEGNYVNDQLQKYFDKKSIRIEE